MARLRGKPGAAARARLALGACGGDVRENRVACACRSRDTPCWRRRPSGSPGADPAWPPPRPPRTTPFRRASPTSSSPRPASRRRRSPPPIPSGTSTRTPSRSPRSSPSSSSSTWPRRVTNATYINPLPDVTRWERTDQGVDATMNVGAPILAPCRIKILDIEPDWYAAPAARVLRAARGRRRRTGAVRGRGDHRHRPARHDPRAGAGGRPLRQDAAPRSSTAGRR